MDLKDKSFDILLESFKNISSTYTSNFWAATSSTLLFMGWLISSNDAQDFFAGSLLARSVVTIAAALCMYGHWCITDDFCKSSTDKWNVLKDHLDGGFIDNYRIRNRRLLMNRVIVLALLILDIILLWTVKSISANTTAATVVDITMT